MSARVVAVIPARGGSKGIPGKNLARVGGISLIARSVYAARATKSIERVYVSTDDESIAAAAAKAGAEVILRPAELAADTSSSESALLHACDQIESELGIEPGVLVFIQATSPFIDPAELDAGIARVLDGEFDSLFAAAETYEFLWRYGPSGAVGINHESSYRPRRQDREPHYRETGAFYVMKWPGFRSSGHRFFGRIGLQIVTDRSAIDVDTHDDLDIARALAPLVASAELASLPIDAVVMDFDGVHTDDHAFVDQDGREFVRVSRSDGMGVGMLRESGVAMLILSKETNATVARRGEKLGIPVLQGVDDKASALHRWASGIGVSLERVAYLGNDVNDVPAMQSVGVPVAVQDAHPDVLRIAKIRLSRRGGKGAIRELSELIIKFKKEGRSCPGQ